MPKFLDVPRWYGENGNEVVGLGVNPVYGDSPTATPKNFYFNGTANMLYSHSGNSVFNFYAPTTYGSPGQILMGNGIGAPSWTDAPKADQQGVLTWSANAETFRWKQSTTTGEVLTVGAAGDLEWRAPAGCKIESGTITSSTRTTLTGYVKKAGDIVFFFGGSNTLHTTILTDERYNFLAVAYIAGGFPFAAIGAPSNTTYFDSGTLGGGAYISMNSGTGYYVAIQSA